MEPYQILLLIHINNYHKRKKGYFSKLKLVYFSEYDIVLFTEQREQMSKFNTVYRMF